MIQKAGNLIIGCVVWVFPMGLSMMLFSSAMLHCVVMMVCCFFIMVCSTVFMVQMMAFVQTETPENLIGKVVAVMLTVSMCAQPLGNAMYGFLFEACRGFEYAVILFAGAVSLGIAVAARNVLKRLGVNIVE